MKQVLIGLAVLGACKSAKEESAAPSEPASAGAPEEGGKWKPRHRDKTPSQLPSMPTRTFTLAFSKAKVRATIEVPQIYVVGKSAGIVNEVQELPADACADDNSICSVAFHAETLRLPGFQLRVGHMPTAGGEWQCDANRCAKNERRVAKYSTELHVQRVYPAGERALICTSYFTALGKEATSELEAWMAKVCDGVAIAPM